MDYFTFDNDYRLQGYHYLVGVDEAGRGPLAGPLVVASVILPPSFNDRRIKDSKALHERELKELSVLIKEVALDYALVIISPEEIDTLNIYQATRVGMSRAVNDLTYDFDFVLTDAMPLSGLKVGHDSLVKGDAQSLVIAAASILAKVARDEIMETLDELHPLYDFKNNKGYPTKKHIEALNIYGPVRGIHRYTYKPVKDALNYQIKLF